MNLQGKKQNPLGINLWNWVNGLGPECISLIDKIKAMGFTAVEIPMTTPDLPPGLSDKIRDSGLAVSLCAALGPGRDLSHHDPSIRESTMEYMLRCLETAREVGASVFAGPLYAGGGKRHLLSDPERLEELDLAVRGLKALAKYAEDDAVLLAIEPINRYRTSVINTVDQVIDLIDRIDSKNVGVHFDTFHAGIEEDDIVLAMEKVLKRDKMFHFHACANHRGAPGQGFFPWEQIFETLRTHEYQGHITMETFAPGGLDSGWVQMGGSPDQIAEFGLNYMKTQLAR